MSLSILRIGRELFKAGSSDSLAFFDIAYDQQSRNARMATRASRHSASTSGVCVLCIKTKRESRHSEIVKVLQEVRAIGYEVLATENLYLFDGKPGFSSPEG